MSDLQAEIRPQQRAEAERKEAEVAARRADEVDPDVDV
jgi:hypothetical protein